MSQPITALKNAEFNAVSQTPDGEHAMDQRFKSADAYLRMWERTGMQ